MKKIFLTICLSWILCISALSQKSRKIDEVGSLDCENIMARVDVAAQQFAQSNFKKIYFIYYEGNHYEQSFYNTETKKYERRKSDPKQGEAFNRVRDYTLYLTKGRHFPKSKFAILNGGYREEFTIKIWFGTETEVPKPTPTLEKQNITFSKGKPFRVKDCTALYNHL